MALTFSSSDVLNTVGCIDGAFARDGSIEIGGWVASTGPLPTTRITVVLNGKPQPDADIIFGIKSDDVKDVHPNLLNVEHARFAVKLNGVVEPPAVSEDLQIVITPWADQQMGRPLFRLLNSTVPEPPREYLERVGGQIEVGFEVVGHLIGLADLKPDAKLLDVGCGTGRVAFALRPYLSQGRYEGLDIVPEFIEWTSAEITSRVPSFRFTHADIESDYYNPNGTILPNEFRFPYEDAEFDFVILASVFTHMCQPEIEQYLNEIKRVLRPGGRCFATALLLDEVSKPLQDTGKGVFHFTHPLGGGLSLRADISASLISFEAENFLGWITDRGFAMHATYPGWWSGRFPYLSCHDLLVFDKPMS